MDFVPPEFAKYKESEIGMFKTKHVELKICVIVTCMLPPLGPFWFIRDTL